MKFHAALLVVALMVAGFSYHDCRDVTLWWLEAAPALVMLAAHSATYRAFTFSNTTYIWVFIACVWMLGGAHYTYSEVPFFNWLRDHYGLARNYYDRVGHVWQGVVPALIIRELMMRVYGLRVDWFVALVMMMACIGLSAIYEIVEMGVAIYMHGEVSQWFLGMQEDGWDAQKDMLMASFGALVALVGVAIAEARNNRKRPKTSSC